MLRLKPVILCGLVALMLMPLVTRAQDDNSEPAPLAAVGLEEIVTWDYFARIVHVTHADDDSGRLFVVQQTGKVWIIDSAGDLLEEPFLDLTEILTPAIFLDGYDHRGLVGMAFHPDYAENGRFFVNYTDDSGDTTLARYVVSDDDPDRADHDSAEVLLTINQPFDKNNGGHLAFGSDGYLYLSVGDGDGQCTDDT